MTEELQPFDQWAIVDVMGHQRYVGHVTEQVIAGKGFVRVDVPANDENCPWSKLIGTASIYSITPVSEEIGRAMANNRNDKPIEAYELTPRLTAETHIPLEPTPVEPYDDGGPF